MRPEVVNRLAALEARHEELTQALADPAIFSDQGRYQQVAREHAGLTQIVSAYREYQKIVREIDEAETLSR